MANEYAQHLNRQVQLCDRLERLADSLPRDCNVQECLHVAHQVGRIVKQAHRFEEGTIFPLLLSKMSQQVVGLPATLERLTSEHAVDDDFANDLTSAIEEFAAGSGPVKADLLSWMLRAFFETTRRHVAFEKEHVLPILEKVT